MARLLFSFCVGALGFASVIGSAACSTHTIITARPEPTVTFEKTCAKTACEVRKTCAKQSSCDDVDGCMSVFWTLL